VACSAGAVAPVRYQGAVPALFAAREHTARRAYEFFTVAIRNANTRRAYARAASQFSAWCAARGISDVRLVQPVHVAAYVQALPLAALSVTQHLAALRTLFDWLVVGQVLAVNPAASVRRPRHSSRSGKTPVLSGEEVRAVIDSIDTSNAVGLRDRALIGTMVYTFARVGAVIGMRVEDVYGQGQRTWVRLYEKGGKRHEMPCHHQLAAYLREYLAAIGCAGGSRATVDKGWLFRSAVAATGTLSDRPLRQADVYRMIARRAQAAGVHARIGCHSFRASGITEYLRAGGRLEVAQVMANHASPLTTGLYDRRVDRVSLEEVERLAF
jgi:site-specific recombinase XerD